MYESVKKLRMFRGGKYIGTGLSGGKDSASLLYSLTKVFPENEYVAIYLHHGIGDYSRDSYVKAKVLAEKIKNALCLDRHTTSAYTLALRYLNKDTFKKLLKKDFQRRLLLTK